MTTPEFDPETAHKITETGRHNMHRIIGHLFANTDAPSDIASDVVLQILARDAHGQRKYGVTLDRTDLSVSDWLQHMAEELMDGAHYALAAKREIKRECLRVVQQAFDETLHAEAGQWDEKDYAIWRHGVDAFMTALQKELSK